MSDFVLREILESNRRQEKLLLEILRVDQQIAAELNPPPLIESFAIKESSMLPIAPGFSPQFTATPEPAGAVTTTAPSWTSSDTTDAPITVDATGLVVTVNIPKTAPVGKSFTLSVNYTNPDGTVANGAITLTIVAPPAVDVTGFSIAQTL